MALKLNFREKGIPKYIKQRIVVLTVAFLASLVFFQIMMNREESDRDVVMAQAKLPVVSVASGGTTMAELHGYVTQMDACYMRDALIPLGDDRTIDTTILTYGAKVSDVSYELRSLDTERKIADTKVEDWESSDGKLHADIRIENLVEEGEEYLLVLILQADGRKVYYYTRVMPAGDGAVDACLDFAKFFHDTAMSDNWEDLASYMETSQYSDKDTLADVGIDSSVNQVGWRGFNGSIVEDPLVEVTDISDSYVSLVYEYQMKEDGDESRYYNVEEYFKIRYTPEQVYLLDYRRTMRQILLEGSVKVKDNVVDLGVAGDRIEYLSNETGTVVSFVQAGELYEYDQSKKELTKVFGFIEDPLDKRQRYGQHAVRILNIDETGNMDFVVYGYMNRGSHEGECGIDLYHYDRSSREAVEQVFISSTHSYQILNANFSDLLFENSRGDFYIMMGGTLAKVALGDLTTEEIIRGLHTDQYAVSSSGQYVAWIEEGRMSKTLSVMDLETEKVRTIEAPEGSLIKPLAFMTEDLVYGIADENDILPDAAGTTVYAMKQIKIVNTAGDFDELKVYEKPGIFVTEAEKDGFTLYLSRVEKKDGAYAETSGDTIKDSAGEKNKVVDVSLSAEKGRGSVTQLTMTPLGEGNAIRTVAENRAQLAVASQAKNLSVSTTEQEQTYFVYVGNSVTLTTQNLTRAIAEADEQMGIVVDNRQNYIWKRGRNAYVNAFSDVEVGTLDASSNSSAGAISAMLARKGENTEIHSQLEQGETPVNILQNGLKEELVLDLTGCTLTQVLYYVSEGAPVYARTGENEAVLIIGYDAANIIVYQSTNDTYRKIASDDAAAMFDQAGSVYISYIE